MSKNSYVLNNVNTSMALNELKFILIKYTYSIPPYTSEPLNPLNINGNFNK